MDPAPETTARVVGVTLRIPMPCDRLRQFGTTGSGGNGGDGDGFFSVSSFSTGLVFLVMEMALSKGSSRRSASRIFFAFCGGGVCALCARVGYRNQCIFRRGSVVRIRLRRCGWCEGISPAAKLVSLSLSRIFFLSLLFSLTWFLFLCCVGEKESGNHGKKAQKRSR